MSQKKKMLQRFTWLTGKLNASFDSTISGRGNNNHSFRRSLFEKVLVICRNEASRHAQFGSNIKEKLMLQLIKSTLCFAISRRLATNSANEKAYIVILIENGRHASQKIPN